MSFNAVPLKTQVFFRTIAIEPPHKRDDSEVRERVERLTKQIPKIDDYSDKLFVLKPSNGNNKSGAQATVGYSVSGANSPVVIKSYSELNSFETELWGLLESQGISHGGNIRGVGKPDGKVTIVLDDAGKHDLVDFVNEERKLSEKEIFQLAHQILECLKELHNRGIIHRDVKPENIIIRFESGELEFTLADLGIMTKDCENPERCLLGSPHYASPEYALVNKSSPYQDIWSLGYAIFAAFSGESLIEHFTDQADWRLGLLQEMQMIFGKFPQSMIKDADEDVKNKCFKKKRSWKKPWKTKYVLKEPNFKCKSLAERMANFPESIKKLLRMIFKYEGRPTAEELLNLDEMKKDVCFKVVVPTHLVAKKLLIASVINDQGEIVEREFDLRKKSFSKTHHHIPKSVDGEYKVVLIDSSNNILHGCKTEIENLQGSIEYMLSLLPKEPDVEYVNLVLQLRRPKDFANIFEGLELIVESNTEQGTVETIFKIEDINSFRVPISLDNKYKISFKSAIGEILESNELLISPGENYSLG